MNHIIQKIKQSQNGCAVLTDSQVSDQGKKAKCKDGKDSLSSKYFCFADTVLKQ